MREGGRQRQRDREVKPVNRFLIEIILAWNPSGLDWKEDFNYLLKVEQVK